MHLDGDDIGTAPGWQSRGWRRKEAHSCAVTASDHRSTATFTFEGHSRARALNHDDVLLLDALCEQLVVTAIAQRMHDDGVPLRMADRNPIRGTGVLMDQCTPSSRSPAAAAVTAIRGNTFEGDLVAARLAICACHSRCKCGASCTCGHAGGGQTI